MDAEIYKKLEVMDGKLDQLIIWKAEHIKSHEFVEENLSEVRRAVFENPGLKSKVERLWNCKNDITKWKEFWLWILRYLILTGVIGLITWLLMLYKNTP